MTQVKTIKSYYAVLSSRAQRALLIVLVLLFSVMAAGVPKIVEAISAEQQIAELKAQNAANQRAVSDLRSVAVSYEDAIAKLQSQINTLQSQINANEAEKANLEQQIIAAQAELDRQKAVLGVNIKSMYVNSEMSTIEMLATSKDLSDFVDKDTYRNSVQRQIQDTMTKITALQNELNAKKKQIEDLLTLLSTQRNEIDHSRAEQANLLSMNKQQQAEYNAQTKNNQSKITELNKQIAAQRNANRGNIVPDGGYYFIRFPGGVGSFNPNSYPYQNSGFSMSTAAGCGNPDPRTGQRDSVDEWGYCTRQCVSFTAWAVEASGRSAPRNYGSAKNWINRAPSSYIHRTPQVGDIAISTGGTWGHAMYVAGVSGGKFQAWEYNQQLDGELQTTRWVKWQ